MLGQYFYHEIIKKTIIGFGTLFNDIHIKHKNADDDLLSDIKVPLAYGPIQKFLAKVQQQEELSQPVAINLPRMSFEMTSISYDSTRKSGITQTFKSLDNGGKVNKVYLPVPYNIGFRLSLLSKLNDDALQVVEQVLPFFQPSFNITIDLVDAIGEKRDIPIVLNSIDFQDDYEGDFSSRRSLIYTFDFTAKTYLFGPLEDSSDSIIRKAQVDVYTSTDIATAKRELRYTVSPDPIDANPGDPYGYQDSWEMLFDGREYSPTQQKDI
jgi:hypothetical protein